VTRYEAILALLDDGDWHGIDELESLTSLPDQWIEELRLSGHHVVERDGRVRLLEAESFPLDDEP
jgi:hypothetical protein